MKKQPRSSKSITKKTLHQVRKSSTEMLRLCDQYEEGKITAAEFEKRASKGRITFL